MPSNSITSYCNRLLVIHYIFYLSVEVAEQSKKYPLPRGGRSCQPVSYGARRVKTFFFLLGIKKNESHEDYGANSLSSVASFT